MAGELSVFGIRHHGPGSAYSLERALDALDPAVVLIEGPPEADELIKFVADASMRPPVALLVYAVDDPGIASFYPFAEYSPEWRAALWGLKRNRPVRFIDLPAEHTLARRKPSEKDESETAEATTPEEPPDEIERDPLTALARVSGREDGESWWNDLIEETDGATPLFAAIESAMAVLREKAPPRRDYDWNEKREAHMRLAIAETLKAVDGKVAAVVGAWHAPALHAKRSASEDRAQLKGLPKVKVAATWAPWSEPRLAAASGYGAGVVSPRWYHHLWSDLIERGGNKRDGRRLVAQWLTLAAHMMRSGGHLAAPASVIEAVRLAETLAIMRDRALPGLVEIRDAFLTTLAHGEEAHWKLIEKHLVIGTEVGEIPQEVPQTPLQADLQRELKRLRLKLEAAENEASLDLRTDTGQQKSWLFHRLRLLNVPWAAPLDAGRSRGTFREKWNLHWQPEYAVRLVEALVWGATIEQASNTTAYARADASNDLRVIADTVRECLYAGLRQAADMTLTKLQRTAATSTDVGQLMEASAPLAEILRYGSAREFREDDLRRLLVGMGETACVNLRHACRNLDAEASTKLVGQIKEFDRATTLLEADALTSDWRAALAEVADDRDTMPLIAGTAVRLLYDASVIDAPAAEHHLERALSPAVPSAQAGEWLDGFLAGGGHVLLHDQALRAAVDRWLVDLREEEFTNLLPMLRRAFATFDAMERRRLLEEVREPSSATRALPSTDDDAPGFEKSLPLLKLILGLS